MWGSASRLVASTLVECRRLREENTRLAAEAERLRQECRQLADTLGEAVTMQLHLFGALAAADAPNLERERRTREGWEKFRALLEQRLGETPVLGRDAA